MAGGGKDKKKKGLPKATQALARHSVGVIAACRRRHCRRRRGSTENMGEVWRVRASAAGAAIIVVVLAVVGSPRWPARTVIGQQPYMGDAFPVPKRALRAYLDHTGGSSKLARREPQVAERLQARGDDVPPSAVSAEGRWARWASLAKRLLSGWAWRIGRWRHPPRTISRKSCIW